MCPRFSGTSAGSMRQLSTARPGSNGGAKSRVDFPDFRPSWNSGGHTYIPWPAPRHCRGPFSIRATSTSAPLRAAVPARSPVVCNMRNRRRRVFIDTQKGRVSAGFTVAAEADAADVSMRLRERGWIAYRLRLEAEQHAWIATVIDWARRAA